MAQVKISNLVQQNGPRPLPRKSKMLRNTQDTDGNNGHRLRVGNAQGARFNLHLLQRSSDNRGLPEGIALVKSFDETPITVTNKSFSQLLEEKLSDTLPANTASSQLSKPKKSFLKKGEGLAKFRQKQSSCPSSVPKCSVVDCHVQNKNKNDVIKNVTGDHEQRIVKTFLRKGSGLKRFRLKPITGSRKNLYRSRKNSNLEANNCSERTNWNPNSNNISAKTLGQVTTDKDTQQADHQLDTHQAVNGYSSEGTEREYDGPSFTLMHEDKIQDEFEELRTFELLEQQAANSSFSSNCSFVGRILQISTQSSFNVNCYGTEELESHANFIPVNPVQNTSSAVNTGIIKQYPELQDPLHCTKQQISDVARKITLLQEDMFKFSDDHKDIADDKTVEQNSCSEVANFIQRISHIQKCVELKDCNEIETDEESIREENSLTSNILHRDLQEQIRKVLIDDFKERKHYNSDTECSILSETMCVSIAEDPHTHSEREQTMFCAHKNSHSNFESDKWESNKYSPVKQEADEAVASSNKRVTPLPDCTPSSAQFGKDYQHTSDRYTHQPGDSEDLNLLKSDLLHKRLTELDAEISIYNEEKLKLCALRKEYEIIIQELLSEKETLKSLIDKERAAINIEREEIAEEKCRLEQYKSELMKEKQVLEGLKQVDVHISLINAENCSAKLVDSVPSKMKDCESEELQQPLDVCSIAPQHFVPSKTVKDAPEAEIPSAQNVILTVPANGNIINSSLNKTHTEKNNHVQSNNIQESDDVKKKTPENGNITDFDDAGINSLPKHDFVHYAAQDSNVSTGEINEYINILDDNTLINRKIIPSKLHSADQNVDSDMISNDRVTHIKTHPDGRKEIWYNNGCVCKISSDGMSEKIIYYNGDVLERCLKSQTEKYYFCKSKIWCTTYEDKTQLVEFSNGQTELKKPDGTIKTNYINGAAQTVFPDGHVEWVLNDGRQCIIDQNGEKTWYFPNGQKEIHTKDHKRREYPDGTIKYVFPDGSMKTKYANGRIREKDKHGKLIMDSDLQKLFILFDCDMAACHSMWKPILYKPKHQVTIITEALLTYSKTMLPPEER
ncbi:centromere protein J isoform X7 [Schistocerca serialis cubense]|uniref:centromere protein J isoform X7 n=1 Tax=Schistocerca serialis cubense TaxID=2023355 RepID=UPI00214E4640|nr:centromere protein J isoform X7 [Schistocerca serialis cubense]